MSRERACRAAAGALLLVALSVARAEDGVYMVPRQGNNRPPTAAPVAEADEPTSAAAGADNDGIYMVPHLGKNAVMGPVTGRPPLRERPRPDTEGGIHLARVPLSGPSISIRPRDEVQTQPRRRKEKRTVAAEDPSDEEYYSTLLQRAKRHRFNRPNSRRSFRNADINCTNC